MRLTPALLVCFAALATACHPGPVLSNNNDLDASRDFVITIRTSAAVTHG